jgi:hypothetical protein
VEAPAKLAGGPHSDDRVGHRDYNGQWAFTLYVGQVMSVPEINWKALLPARIMTG